MRPVDDSAFRPKAIPWQAEMFQSRVERCARGATRALKSSEPDEPGHPVNEKMKAADPKAEIDHAAADMESLFIFHLLREMRRGVPKSELFGDRKTEETYTAVLDMHLSQELARSRSIGLAAMVRAELAGPETDAEPLGRKQPKTESNTINPDTSKESTDSADTDNDGLTLKKS